MSYICSVSIMYKTVHFNSVNQSSNSKWISSHLPGNIITPPRPEPGILFAISQLYAVHYVLCTCRSEMHSQHSTNERHCVKCKPVY